MPVGTFPFEVTSFKPNDTVLYKANSNFRDPAKPAFASITIKGGGDAAAAARGVFDTGEYDYAWNLQLSPDVLANMTKEGKGHVVVSSGSLVERLEMNLTDGRLAGSAAGRAFDRETPEPDPVGQACARSALHGDRPRAAGAGGLWLGRQADL